MPGHGGERKLSLLPLPLIASETKAAALMHNDLTEKLFQQAQPPVKPGIRFRETIPTLLIGTLSASLGIVVMWAVVAAILNRPLLEWNHQKPGVSGDFIDLSGLAAFVALVGLMLGLGGIALSRKRAGMISPTSVFGAVVCELTFLVALVHVLLRAVI
jgi:hypothetical protein